MWWTRESGIIDASPEVLSQNRDYKHGRFICSDDGGNIGTLYTRYFATHSTRLFRAINMFQCDKCFQFFAIENGTNTLIPLIVTRKSDTPVSTENEIHEIYKYILKEKRKR